jgi:hypothetical protein
MVEDGLLGGLTDITVFREMCSWLEMKHQEPEQVVIPELFGQEFSYYFEAPW